MAPDRSSFIPTTMNWKRFEWDIIFTLLCCCIIFAQAVPFDDMYGNRQQLSDAGMSQIQCHPDWQWTCSDGMQCIAQYDVCDGIAQCVDHSDERNCERERFRNFHDGRLAQPAPAPSPPSHPNGPATKAPTPAATEKVKTPPSEETRLPMERMLGVLTVFVIVAGAIHMLMKRRKRMNATARGFRKGESLVEDEDDLLISQIYNT